MNESFSCITGFTIEWNTAYLEDLSVNSYLPR